MLPCPTPPSRKVCQQELLRILEHGVKQLADEEAQKYENLIHWLKLKEADRPWLLVCIASLDPDHIYFSKDFKPSKAIKKRAHQSISNDDDFFTGLPV